MKKAPGAGARGIGLAAGKVRRVIGAAVFLIGWLLIIRSLLVGHSL